MAKMWRSLIGLKTSLSFILHVLGLAALYAISLRDVDTSTAIVGVVLSYGGTQTAKQISAHQAAFRDAGCDTQKTLELLNEK